MASTNLAASTTKKSSVQLQVPPSNPRISAKEFARYNFASPKKRRSILRRQKFKRGEGIFRMKYYTAAIRTIRKYIAKKRDPKVIQEALTALAAELGSVKRLQRYNIEYNMQAIKQYYALYGRRDFEILPTPKLQFFKGRVIVGAQPDLHVREHGTLLLIKFDFCKTPEDQRFIPLMLQVIRDAARIKGLKVQARNIIVFDLAEKKEYPCPSSRANLKHLVAQLCNEIESTWDNLSA